MSPKRCERCGDPTDRRFYTEAEHPHESGVRVTAKHVCRDCVEAVVEVLKGDVDTSTSEPPTRSEPADFGHGESTGVQDL